MYRVAIEEVYRVLYLQAVQKLGINVKKLVAKQKKLKNNKYLNFLLVFLRFDLSIKY